MPGGFTRARLPTPEVEAITTLVAGVCVVIVAGGGVSQWLRVAAWFVPQMRVIVEGELGDEVKLFKPLMFRSQVVRGVHYIIKVCHLV